MPPSASRLRDTIRASGMTETNDLFEECVDVWGLSDIIPIRNNSKQRILKCRCVDGDAILKISRQPAELERSVSAQRAFLSLCPRVFQFDVRGAVLMEFVDHSAELSEHFPNPEFEVACFCELYRRILQCGNCTYEFMTLSHMAEIFDRVEGSARDGMKAILAMAWGHRHILMETSNLRLLHGDLHHFNILCRPDGSLKMIDPHGVVGHPLYEVGAFLRNPIPHACTIQNWKEVAALRLNYLSKSLDTEISEIVRFGFYGCAFSLAWDIEEGRAECAQLMSMAEHFANLGFC